MIYFLALLILIWAILFTATRLLRYYRIESDYRQTTSAKVVSHKKHVPTQKKEKPAIDVLLSYVIDGKEGLSEITVPLEAADTFETGSEHMIRYMVSGNGAVHIASDTGAVRRILFGHIAALLCELAAFVVIWQAIL